MIKGKATPIYPLQRILGKNRRQSKVKTDGRLEMLLNTIVNPIESQKLESRGGVCIGFTALPKLP